jgi:hypothetical protein
MGLPLEMYDKIGFSMPLKKALQISYWMHYKIREAPKERPWDFYSKKGKVAVNVKHRQIHSKIHKVVDFVYFLYLKKYVY